MKQFILGTAIVVLSASALAQPYRFVGPEERLHGSSAHSSSDVEMRNPYNPDPSNTYRGSVDSDGSVRMRNYEGDTLHGNVDSSGYGSLHSDDGSSYGVKPRY